MLAGCSAVLGIEDLHPSTVHGVVRDLAADTVPNASVVLYRDPAPGGVDSTRIDGATTDDHGAFDLAVTAALPLDGYFDLADPRFVRTFDHLSQPVVDHADLDVEILTLNAITLQKLAADAGKAQDAARWLVVAQVVDAGGSTLEGATVHAEVGEPPVAVSEICYTNLSTGAPCDTGTTTRGDGNAWLFNIPETTSLHITATDADGHAHAVSFPVIAGPGLVITPVPPMP
jgi:hypothetical protein